MANIAQSLAGDLEHITVANPGGVQGVRPTLPAIKYSMKMKEFGLDETKLFHFLRIFKINERYKIHKAKPTSFIHMNPLSRNP